MHKTIRSWPQLSSTNYVLSFINTPQTEHTSSVLKHQYRRIALSSGVRTPHRRTFATMDAKPAPMPKLLYGTAWKKDATADLVSSALKAGFRGIDTAAQPRHYKEPLVGAAVKSAIAEGVLQREELFIQTKFTSIDGQDLDDLPYSPEAPLEEQVHTSVASSLQNFRCHDAEEPYIDSFVLHSPLRKLSDTTKVWKTLETYVPHKIRQLGISNAPLSVVDYLCTSPDITVRPACVQNRFYPATRWEVGLRAYCRQKGIRFQTFWTLSGNPQLLRSAPVQLLASNVGIESAVALYSLVLGLEGTSVLDGTTNETHMNDGLRGIETVSEYAETELGRPVWSECLGAFKKLIGEQD
ncbi:Aldo/keto reductase [Whalleya microplaca]|nr:Aldo/keto reductase [Whalleya microplaca]